MTDYLYYFKMVQFNMGLYYATDRHDLKHAEAMFVNKVRYCKRLGCGGL